MEYTTMTTAGGRYRHLGSRSHGMRTYCGRLLDAKTTLVEPFGAVDVGCLTCKKTSHYRKAEAVLDKTTPSSITRGLSFLGR